ncbi:cytochrome P450 [Mycena epipterygia]|nr:cytochrome P450 [Mycena epipterygia]
MHVVLRIILPLLATAVAYLLLMLAELLWRDFSSPLRKLPGPSNPSLVFGNFKELEDDPRVTRLWRRKFGPTFKFKGSFNTPTVYTADTIAIEHILKTTGIYQKTGTRLVKDGLLAVQGDVHKRQAMMVDGRSQNPAFGTAQIRNLTDLFLDKSVQLRDLWKRQVAANGRPTRIDVLSSLSKITLDIIGQAGKLGYPTHCDDLGFNFQFDSLNPNAKPNEVQEVVYKLLHSPTASRERTFRMDPFMRLLPTPGRKVFNDARQSLSRFGNTVLADAKANIIAVGDLDAVSSGRDLFSLLLKANMSDDRMSDAELADHPCCSLKIPEIPTFLFAGHATTSSAISWALHGLSINKSAQTKLREELLTLATDKPTLDELNTLVYLDWVVKETLRVYPPVAFVTRTAVAEDILPLGTPCVDSQGISHNGLHIPKGTTMRVPISDVNTDPHLWGDDAGEFRPERWEKVPEAVNTIPGVWANLLTFLAGPHNCIGFRFSLAEQKALLFVLIRAFEFDRAVPDGTIGRTSGGLQSSFVLSEREKGSQMPLIVKAYQA